MKQKTAVSTLLASLVAASLLLLPCQASGAVVQDIQFSFAESLFYSGADQAFTFSEAAVTGELNLPGGPLYGYSIHSAMVSFTDSALISDDSAGGVASGTFAGGITLTVTGRVVENATNTEYAPAGSTLIVATMDDGTWVIEEPHNNFAVGHAQFTTTDGLLYSGLEAGDVTMTMEEFVMGFYTLTTGELTHFGDDDIAGMAPAIHLHIPEPATLSLLSLGVLALSRKRKKNV